MNFLSIGLVFASGSLFINPAKIPDPLPVPVAVVQPVVWDKPAILALVHEKALEYDVSEDEMVATINCESGFNIKAVGDHESSLGLSQIHLPAWAEITPQQAYDPAFAVDFMARQFQAGNKKIWTCWRQLYASKK